ncbi:MAG: cytochrome c oxidase assembly protein [Spirochaetaceae bacterium]|nr:cytochrome c oxidase assembly protein [Spirochaetaceae bacterium]
MLGAWLSTHDGTLLGPPDAPPPLTAVRLLTGWEPAVLPLAGAAVVGGLYLYGVHRLRRRGDAWSRWRTVLFVGLGLGSFVVATTSGLAVYDTTLLWVHMVQHMVLGMVAPVLLALGAPITLALRLLPRRGKSVLLDVLHSRVAKVATFPVVAGAIFVATPVALYLTGWYEATLRNPLLHDLNHLHFVMVGCLWFWPILGLDPMPMRLPYPMRLLAVFVTMPFHAFLGVTIMGASTVIARDYYVELGRTWGPSLAKDQEIAGGVLWASGDLIALLVLGALFVQWARASEREAVREDRRLDRLEAARRT